MSSKYKAFIFEGYSFSEETGELLLQYGYDDSLHFTERFRFDFEFGAYEPATLDLALQQLFFMAGVSYYKMYLAPEIVIRKGEVDGETAVFLSETYQKGLGEFFYVNGLDPRTPIVFPVTADRIPSVTAAGKGLLVGIGGGKDSLVSVELLKNIDPDIATWSLNHRPQLTPLIERIGLPHYWVERELDPQVRSLNASDALNGHIPISAIFAAVGTVVGVLSGRRDHIVSNEQSANEPTLEYQGVSINHQYSKSQEFEQRYQALLQARFGENQRYYSLLRPLSELRIAEIFAVIGFDKYHDVFSSCNRAFTHDSHILSWDATCAKCAFVFLALTPFVEREKLEALFGSKNLLLDTSLEQTYRQLLGIEGDKPLECVGEVRECRAAMRLAEKQLVPLRDKYDFDVPAAYDFRQLMPHAIPQDVWDIMRPYYQ